MHYNFKAFGPRAFLGFDKGECRAIFHPLGNTCQHNPHLLCTGGYRQVRSWRPYHQNRMHSRTMVPHSDVDTSTIGAFPFEASKTSSIGVPDSGKELHTRWTVITELALVVRNTLTATCDLSEK